MKIVIDLDGTICTEEKQFSRSLAKVNPGAKKALNLLKKCVTQKIFGDLIIKV